MKPKLYWTFEKCKEEALKYEKLSDFKLKSSGACNSANKHGWVKEITSHMIHSQKPTGYWNFENCKKESLKYKYRNDFCKGSNGAYNSARKHKWLDEICEHMDILGNLKFRLIYSYEFPDNYVYVGLTCNENKRNSQHLKKGPVHEHILKTNLNPIKKILTDGYIDVKESQKMEKYWLDKYISDGWKVLNSVKTGAIGANKLLWTFEKCKEEALKYNNKTDFKNMSSGAYYSSYKHKWLNEICNHMVELRKINGYWTFEKCKEEALKYNNKTNFRNMSNSAYTFSRKHKWLNEICNHMVELRKINGYWTFEKCKEEALKYNNIINFKNGNSSAFNVSYKNKWLDDICSHMITIHNPYNYWTFEKCKEEALKYNKRSDFKLKSSASYDSARRNKWLDDICLHMIELKKSSNYWNFDNCKKESLKYNKRSDFNKKSSNAYRICLKNNWLDIFYT